MEKIYTIIYNTLMAYSLSDIILGVVIIVLLILQIALYVGLYKRIYSFRLMNRARIREEEPAISVVTTLFSEDSEYLDNTLPRLLTQDYSKFEVVVVYVGNNNDFFSDLKSLKNLYPNLSPVHIDSSPHYPVSTKLALNVGIKSSNQQYDFIVITSSDATPSSGRWLSLLAKGFLYGDIVLGYCGMQKAGGFASFIFREYQFNSAIAWMSSAIRRRTYAASHNALGFKKSLYFDVNGFNHLDMNVGVGDLFLQQIATRDNVSVVLSPRATCSERTLGGWRWWWNHIKSQQSTHRFYPRWAMAPTIAELLFRTLFFASVITALIFLPFELKIAALVAMAIRYFFVLFVTMRNARRLGESSIVPLHFIYDFIEPLLRLIVVMSSRGKQRSRWA